MDDRGNLTGIWCFFFFVSSRLELSRVNRAFVKLAYRVGHVRDTLGEVLRPPAKGNR
jgi:hypothetical protein